MNTKPERGPLVMIGGGKDKRKVCHISVLRDGLWLPMCNRQLPASHDQHERQCRPATAEEKAAYPVCKQCQYQLGDIPRRGRYVSGLLALALSMSMVLLSCSSDSSVTSQPAYDATAVSHVMADMVASREWVSPSGGQVSANDQAQMLKVVEEACKGPGKIQALLDGPMRANPYLLAMTMKLVYAGCPKLVSDMGIKVNQ